MDRSMIGIFRAQKPDRALLLTATEGSAAVARVVRHCPFARLEELAGFMLKYCLSARSREALPDSLPFPF